MRPTRACGLTAQSTRTSRSRSGSSSASVRGAFDHGYAPTVVAGAAATRDLPDGLGGVIPADVLHRAALAGLVDRVATVVETTADLP